MACAVLVALPVRAQEAVLRVETNDPAAHVFADSTWLGTAVREPFTLAPGLHEVRVVPSAIGTWGVPSLSFEVRAAAGDTVEVEAAFPYLYRIVSRPGAEALLDAPSGVTALGGTPVVYRSAGRPEGYFRLEREGFVPALVRPGTELWNLHEVTLEPVRDPDAESLGISVQEVRGPRRWIDYATVGVAVAAGVVAVHYKQKADRRYDVYRETGDPTLRPAIDRYDRYSAVALGTMQVGIGVFAIRLALR
jgi:hypothetical protein